MVLLALLLAAIGSLTVYLAAAHQTWLPAPWPAGRARLAGAVLLGGALALLCRALQPLAGGFVFSIYLMLLFLAWPYLGALARVGRAD